MEPLDVAEFTSTNEDGVVSNLLRFEQNNGKYFTNNVSIESRMMFINVGRHSLSVFGSFTFLALNSIKNVKPNEISLFVDGMSIVQKICVNEKMLSTCIVTENAFDSKQWVYHYKKHYPSMKVRIFEKSKLHSIAYLNLLETSDVVVTTRMDQMLALEKFFFQRIVIYTFDSYFYKKIGRRCNFVYSFNQHFIIHYSQQFQTFQLNHKNEPKITILYYDVPFQNQTCNFTFFAFPTVQRREQDEFTCPVCLEDKESVLRTKCNHNVCCKCLQTSYLLSAMTNCPLCRSELFNTVIVETFKTNVDPDKELDYFINKFIENPSKKIIFDCKSNELKHLSREFQKQFECFQNGSLNTIVLNPSSRLPSIFCDLSCVDFVVVVITQHLSKEFVTFVKSVFKCIYILSFKNMYTDEWK